MKGSATTLGGARTQLLYFPVISLVFSTALAPLPWHCTPRYGSALLLAFSAQL